MNFNTINGAYSKLIKHFEHACSDSQLTIKRSNTTGFTCKPIANQQVEIKFLLRLPQWPHRKLSSKKVDIIITSSEIFSCASKKAISSRVGIKYLNINGAAAEPLLDIHYDYEIKKAHPIFHAQFGSVEINTTELKELNFNQVIGPTKNGYYANVRIPTPYMNITSVLLSLAADHLFDNCYSEFLKNVRENSVVKWDVACGNLSSHLKKTGYVHSHSWYPD